MKIYEFLLHYLFLGADDGNGLMLYLTFSDVLNTELINRTEPVITTLLHYSNSLPYVVCSE